MKSLHIFSFKSLFILSITLLCTVAGMAQNYQEVFGKNRVQHHKFTWFEYKTDNFIVYWSGDTRSVAHTTIQMAEWDYADIQEILEHRINRKIEILVYEDITDVKQSNIGNDEAFMNTGGQTKIVENKIFVYFDGDHTHLRKQIREGIAQVYINNMLFGSNLQEVVQNAVLLNLPEWFTQGLAGYVGEKWNTDLDNQLRDVFASKKYKDFEEFAANEPKLAGQSLWYYLDVNYGQSTVSNLIYLTRINRSVSSGFLYVLGSPYGRTLINWREYFEERYAEGNKSLQLPKKSNQLKFRNKRKLPVANAKLSPDGQHILYSTNELGKQKVYVQNLKDGKRKMIFKTGFRNNIQATDYNYPLMDWTPNSQMVGIIYEKRDVVKFLQIELETGQKVEQDFAPKYQRVYSMDYLNNNDLIISGSIRGVSDIFIYHINQRSTDRITNDFYDDLEAVHVKLNGKDGIMFKSNRGDYLSTAQNGLDSIIPFGSFDIYYHEIGSGKELARITNTPYSNESSPIAIDSTNYGFLSDMSGVRNRYTGELEEYIAYYEKVVVTKKGDELLFHPDSIPGIDDNLVDTTFIRAISKIRGKNQPSTGYKRNIIAATTNARSGKLVENIYHDGQHHLYISQIDPSQKASIYNTSYRQQLLKVKAQEQRIEQENQQQDSKPKEDKPKPSSSWEFETDFGATEPEKEPTPSTPETTSPVKKEDDGFGFVFITDYVEDPKEDAEEADTPTPESIENDEESVSSNENNDTKDEGLIDIDNYQFEDDFNTEVTDAAVIVESDEGRVTLQSPNITRAKEVYKKPEKKVHRFYTPRILSHRRKFKANSVTVQLDNSQLFGGLDIYNGEPFDHQPPSILLQSSVQDLFEDYELIGGIRVPTSFNGLEYFVTVKDDRRRLDKAYSFYRSSLNETVSDQAIANPNKRRTTSNLIQAEFKYPLDIYQSFRGTIRFRNDHLDSLANDLASLEAEPYRRQRASLRLEYVFDNTIDISLNVKHGTRLKVYGEVYKNMEVDLFDGFKWDFSAGNMFLIGADIRHYQRLGKHAVLATRATGATSLGSDKILYFIGGGDSELFPGFNANIPLPDPNTGEFAYQTLATPLRGFKTNIRNGNSFFLGNVELRVPILKYFYDRPIKSSFVKNFQLVGFFDVGTAWRGKSPFSNNNPLNTATLAPPPESPQVITVNVNYFRDPIVAGFGGGIRTKLFGYFIRLDYGVGIETKQLQKGVWHLSLGTDF